LSKNYLRETSELMLTRPPLKKYKFVIPSTAKNQLHRRVPDSLLILSNDVFSMFQFCHSEALLGMLKLLIIKEFWILRYAQNDKMSEILYIF